MEQQTQKVKPILNLYIEQAKIVDDVIQRNNVNKADFTRAYQVLAFSEWQKFMYNIELSMKQFNNDLDELMKDEEYLAELQDIVKKLAKHYRGLRKMLYTEEEFVELITKDLIEDMCLESRIRQHVKSKEPIKQYLYLIDILPIYMTKEPYRRIWKKVIPIIKTGVLEELKKKST